MEPNTIYTRQSLRFLKEETDRKHQEEAINRHVSSIRYGIISTASETNKTSYYYHIQLVSDNTQQYTIVMNTIARLKEQFIDLDIEYKSQKDARTGKEINHGIYIDWSELLIQI